MEVFFETDFDIMLIMENGFEVPRDQDNKILEKTRWSKKQREEHLANSKAIHHLLNVLPQQEVTRVGTYSSAKELWEKLVELHEAHRRLNWQEEIFSELNSTRSNLKKEKRYLHFMLKLKKF